jgi:hypothetical protein
MSNPAKDSPARLRAPGPGLIPIKDPQARLRALGPDLIPVREDLP